MVWKSLGKLLLQQKEKCEKKERLQSTAACSTGHSGFVLANLHIRAAL